MRDMVPPTRRSIRDIPVPASVRRREAEAHTVEEDYMERHQAPRSARRTPNKRRRLFLISAIVVVVLCAIGGLLLSTLFAGATVTVYPREEQVTAPQTLTAKATPASGEVALQIMTVTRSASTTVNASGTHQVSRSASGIVTIYNDYSTASQRLINNTRFAAPDGKIYRLHDSVVVPGAVQNADKTLTPGSVSVTIYADSPGDSYNRGETRFTIPGFQGDPRYDKFYAEGVAMTGGFVGSEPAVAAADLTSATAALKQGLSQAAEESITSQIPSGYLAVPGTLQVSFSDVSQSPGTGSTAVLAQTATMSGAIIKDTDLASAIAKQTVSDYTGEAVGFADISQITIASATTTKAGDALTLMLSGSPTLVWQFDPGALKAALVGKNKATFESIVESFAPAIARAEAKVRPFWQSSFPTDPNKIDVVVATQ